MLSIVNSCNLIGIDGFIVNVEVDITRGMPCFNIVGLASIEIKEAKERVKSAIINSGFEFPAKRIVVNLSPADIKKEGSLLDLPISIGLLINYIQKEKSYFDETIFVGELSLDGSLKKVRGILPIVLSAKQKGYKRIFIPHENLKESSYVDGIEIIPVKNLRECINYINGKIDLFSTLKPSASLFLPSATTEPSAFTIISATTYSLYFASMSLALSKPRILSAAKICFFLSSATF